MPSSNLGFVSSQKLSHSRTRTSSGPVSQPSPPMTIPKSKNSRSMLIGVCSLLLATGIGFTSAWFIQDGRFSDTGNAPFPFNLTLESSSFSVTIPLETYVTIDYHSDGSEVDYYPIFRQVYSNSVLVPSYFRQCMGAMNLYTIFIGSPLRHRAKFDTRALYDSNTWTLLSMLGEIFNKQILLGFNLLQVRNSPGCQTTPYSPSYVQNMSKLDLPLIYCGSKYVTFPSMIAQKQVRDNSGVTPSFQNDWWTRWNSTVAAMGEQKYNLSISREPILTFVDWAFWLANYHWYKLVILTGGDDQQFVLEFNNTHTSPYTLPLPVRYADLPAYDVGYHVHACCSDDADNPSQLYYYNAKYCHEPSWGSSSLQTEDPVTGTCLPRPSS